MNKPLILKKGDSVGIVAPGALFNPEKFEKGLEHLRSLGLEPVLGPHIFEKDFIFSGTVKQRVQSLKAMIQNKKIKAIWCVRGGAGSYGLMEAMEKLKAPKTSKVIIGMSDVTALHLFFSQKWKWPVLHGPLLDRLGSPECTSLEKQVVSETLFDSAFKLHWDENLKILGKKQMVTGPLIGGNLALLEASLGTSWEVKTENKILFIEDIGERAYRVDRMLTHLQQAGKFKKIKALVVGDFTDCLEADNRELWPEVFNRHFAKAKFPVLLGFPTGHGALRLTLPMGVQVRVSTKGSPHFQVVESYTRDG